MGRVNAELAEAPVQAMSLSAAALARQVAVLADVLDSAHRRGLAIPPGAAQAAEALAALAVCWEANSRGRPAPESAKAALGLGGTP